MYEITVKDIEAIQDIAKTSKNQYEAFVAILKYGVQLGAEEVRTTSAHKIPKRFAPEKCENSYRISV